MEIVSLDKLANLFSSVAQVTFGIAGLFFVALTINEQRRIRWFDSKNFVFVSVSFLMIVSPGIVSLAGLIPGATLVPLTWVSLVLYGIILVLQWNGYRTTTIMRAERSRWKWLDNIWNIKTDALILFAGWFLCLFIPSSFTFVAVGFLLVASVLFSALGTFLLLSSN